MPAARTRKRWCLPDEGGSDGSAPTGFAPLLSRLLARRGLNDAAAAQRFLRPKLTDLDDPADLPGCRPAAGRLAQAVRDQQPVVIYGDYDVDGVTASAILWHTLRALGHEKVNTYVPHRLEEGYGLNAEAISAMADGGWRKADGKDQDKRLPLVVSVDCGITAVDVAAHAKTLGLELIITDHHEFDLENLPDAVALVHPELPVHPPSATHHPPSPLCGAGVAFKVAWQTARAYHNTDSLPESLKRLLLDLLGFAALGTVADVVPLVGENRVITVHGLSRIKDTGFVGLNALIDAAELRTQKVDAYHVGFVLGPRLNACGRMGHAKEAVKLLTDAEEAEARRLAEFLTQENERRRATEKRIADQAKAMVLERGDDADDRRAIVLAHEDWHPGVIGIVASRLVEAFHRPTVLLGIDTQKNLAKGSGRSVDGVDLHAAMSACAEHCTKFGGHAMAAGLSMPPENIDAYRAALVAEVNTRLTPEELCPEVKIDAEVSLAECELGLFREVERLAPFGCQNPKPRLLIRGAITARPGQRMGREGKHLNVSLRDEHGRGLRAVGFGMGDWAEELPAGVKVDAVFEPKTNTWRGVTSPELHLVDVRLSEDV